MNQILLTAPIRNRHEFFHAVSNTPCCANSPTPKNLDGLLDLLREHQVSAIQATNLDLNEQDMQAIADVLETAGARLLH